MLAHQVARQARRQNRLTMFGICKVKRAPEGRTEFYPVNSIRGKIETGLVYRFISTRSRKRPDIEKPVEWFLLADGMTMLKNVYAPPFPFLNIIAELFLQRDQFAVKCKVKNLLP